MTRLLQLTGNLSSLQMAPGEPGCKKVFQKWEVNAGKSNTAKVVDHDSHLDDETHDAHCKKGFVTLTIIFFTRVATVDMVLWEDTRIVPRDSQLWAIYTVCME